jgi:hypothetical protein
MPLGKGVRYRMKDGVRLAFKGNTVVETKDMKTGKMGKMPKTMSHLPKGVSLSPKGDLCAARMKEIEAVFPRGMKGTHAPKMPGACFPTKGMQLPK